MPDQHPASTSDARIAELEAEVKCLRAERDDALDQRYAESDHRAAKYWRAKRVAEVRAEKAEAELAALRADCAVYVTLRHQTAAERDAALAALARVEALADKWAGTPGAYGDHGSCLSAAWREADRELRAALTPTTSKETSR